MADKRFRSMKAFTAYEQGRLLADNDTDQPTLGNPLRVLAAIKKHPNGVSLPDLIAEVGASPAAVDAALLRLVAEELATVKEASGATKVFPAL